MVKVRTVNMHYESIRIHQQVQLFIFCDVMLCYGYFFLMFIQSDYRQDRQVELICCSIEGEGTYTCDYVYIPVYTNISSYVRTNFTKHVNIQVVTNGCLHLKCHGNIFTLYVFTSLKLQ